MVQQSILSSRLASAALSALLLLSACGGGSAPTASSTPPPTPLISSFTVAQSVVPMGDSTTLTWALDASVTSATLDSQAVPVPSGSRLVAPRYRQSYTLVATDGKRTESKVVKVAAQGLDLIAGDLGGGGNLNGTGRQARFTFPNFLAAGPQGTLMVADPTAFNVRRVTAEGSVSSLAGSPVESGYVDGPADTARFGQISGLTVAPDGTTWVIDFGNEKIRKVALDGTVSTFASFAQGGSGWFHQNPALDASGNLYVSGNFTGKVHRFSTSGVVSEFATGFTYPGDLAVLPDGSLLVLETFDGSLWKVDASGARTLLAMTWAPSDIGSGHISGVLSFALDASGGLYLATVGIGLLHRDSAGMVRTIMPWYASQSRDGIVYGMAWMGDRLGMGVSKYGGEIQTLAPGAAPEVLVGWASTLARVDGAGAAARFASPISLALGSQGEIYVADTGGPGVLNGVVRKVGRDGSVTSIQTTPAYSYLNGFTPHLLPRTDGSLLFTDNSFIGSIIKATGEVSTFLGGDNIGLDALSGICADPHGVIYFGENPWGTSNLQIRKLTVAGQLTVLTSGANSGFYSLAGLSIDPAGRVLAADPKGHLVWAVSSAGVASQLAGQAFKAGFQDGPFSTGRLKEPKAVAMHPSGQILICDQGNCAIRVLSSSGVLSTLGGSPDRQGARLGISGVSFTNPTDLAITADGDLIISDGFAILCWTAPFGN